jgi:hypothetical protein
VAFGEPDIPSASEARFSGGRGEALTRLPVNDLPADGQLPIPIPLTRIAWVGPADAAGLSPTTTEE